jgi:hypothetical protein
MGTELMEIRTPPTELYTMPPRRKVVLSKVDYRIPRIESVQIVEPMVESLV